LIGVLIQNKQFEKTFKFGKHYIKAFSICHEQKTSRTGATYRSNADENH
jgi:hypothetical protein